MSSLIRRLQIGMMKRSGMVKKDRPIYDNKGLRVAVVRLVIDNDGVAYGTTFPKAVPEKFRVAA